MSDEPRIILEPAPGKIVVRPDEALKSDRIILTGNQTATIGTVTAVYDPFIKPEEADAGIETEPFYAVGDRVVFGPHSGVKVQVDRISYIVLREQEILLKVKEVSDKPVVIQAGVGMEPEDEDLVPGESVGYGR